MGATVALPLLDAMMPARQDGSSRAAAAAIGNALRRDRDGARRGGLQRARRSANLWSPAAIGIGVRSEADALESLEPYRDYLTIVSNTDVRDAEAFTAPEIGGDHFRSSAVFLTQSHPKQTEGSDIHAGDLARSDLSRSKYGQDTPIPSMQLCIENVDQAGGCAYGYACVYTDSISWASPTEPLPMIRDPRVGVRSAVRRRRDAGRARSERRAETQHSRLARQRRSTG